MTLLVFSSESAASKLDLLGVTKILLDLFNVDWSLLKPESIVEESEVSSIFIGSF